MSKRVANADAGRYVRNLEEFRGSNTWGEWRGHYLPRRYVVFSYGEHWPLFVYEDGKWYENADKFSRSTTKHHGQLHPLCETERHNAHDMVKIADLGVARWMQWKLAA